MVGNAILLKTRRLADVRSVQQVLRLLTFLRTLQSLPEIHRSRVGGGEKDNGANHAGNTDIYIEYPKYYVLFLLKTGLI